MILLEYYSIIYKMPKSKNTLPFCSLCSKPKIIIVKTKCKYYSKG